MPSASVIIMPVLNGIEASRKTPRRSGCPIGRMSELVSLTYRYSEQRNAFLNRSPVRS